jgi:hypothetical protein
LIHNAKQLLDTPAKSKIYYSPKANETTLFLGLIDNTRLFNITVNAFLKVHFKNLAFYEDTIVKKLMNFCSYGNQKFLSKY